MKVVLAYFFLFSLLSQTTKAVCEKASTTYSCTENQSTDSKLKSVWSNDLNFYMAKLDQESLSTDLVGDNTGLGVRNLGIYESNLQGIQSGYFSKVSNGILEKLVLMNVKMNGKLKKEHFTGLDKLSILEMQNGPEFEMDAFDGLKNLRSFRIHTSDITQAPSVVDQMLTSDTSSQILLKNTNIEDFSFENLPDWFKKPQSSSFDIEGSPMRCDASMVFLRNAFNSRDSFTRKMVSSKAPNFICQSPPELKGKKLADISEYMLRNIPTTTRPPITEISTESSQKNNNDNINEIINPDQANSNYNSGGSETTQEGENAAEAVGLQQASAIGIGVGFSVLLLLIILAVLIWFCCRNKKSKTEPTGQQEHFLKPRQ